MQLTGSPQREDHPTFSPDGSKIAYSSKYNNQFDIKIYDIETGQITPAIASPTDDLWPQWLPEGNKILFVSTREKINDLFVYHLEEEREYRLTRTLSGIINPALSPDGRQIIFSTYFKGGSELYLMDMPDMPSIKRRDAELLARLAEGETPRLESAPPTLDLIQTAEAPGPLPAAINSEPSAQQPMPMAMTDQGGRPEINGQMQRKHKSASNRAVL